jgi:hypothetical protein
MNSELKMDCVTMVRILTNKVHPFILDFMVGQAEFVDNSGTLNESIYFASYFADFEKDFNAVWESVALAYLNGSETKIEAHKAILQWQELKRICNGYFFVCMTGN